VNVKASGVALSWEHRQPDASRRLLRAGPDHFDRKGKDQTADNRQPPLAAPVLAGTEATAVSTTACMGACPLMPPHLIVATHLSHGSRAGGQTAPGGIDTLCQYRRY
jgi:hypothetical protein